MHNKEWLDDAKEGPGRYFYKSTGKVYEGEWVDGAPRCGAFRDARPGELPDDDDELEPRPESFPLPALSLLQPEAVYRRPEPKSRRDFARRTSRET